MTSASVKIRTRTPKKFTLALRRPYWAGDGFSVKVNGQPLKDLPTADSYVKITRVWQQDDTVELHLPKVLRKEPLPDNPGRMAFLWGPLVLAGDLGPEVRGNENNDEENPPAPSAPPIVVTEEPLQQWLKPESGSQDGLRRPALDSLRISNLLHSTNFLGENTQSIGMFSPRKSGANVPAEYKAEQEKRQKLQAATIAFAQPGEMQSERDFNEQGEDTAPLLWRGHHGRGGKGWFSFDVPVENTHPVALWVTYGGEGRRKSTFDILIDGKKIADYVALPRSPEQDAHFVDANYAISGELIGGKSKVTVRFQATDGNEIRGVFGLRTVRDDEAR